MHGGVLTGSQCVMFSSGALLALQRPARETQSAGGSLDTMYLVLIGTNVRRYLARTVLPLAGIPEY